MKIIFSKKKNAKIKIEGYKSKTEVISGLLFQIGQRGSTHHINSLNLGKSIQIQKIRSNT